jgi:hypothetical protein
MQTKSKLPQTRLARQAWAKLGSPGGVEPRYRPSYDGYGYKTFGLPDTHCKTTADLVDHFDKIHAWQRT